MHLSHLSLNALCFIPLISVGLAMTNEWHHLIWSSLESARAEGLAGPGTTYGTWYWVQLSFSAVLAVIATTILAYALAKTTARIKPVLAVVLAPVIVGGAHLFSISPLNPLPWFDLSSLGFAAAALMLDRGVLRYGILETIPVLRDRVLEKLTEGVILIDHGGMIIDINSAALGILDANRGQLSNAQLDEYLKDFALTELLHHGKETLEVTRRGRTYDVTGSVLDTTDPHSDVVLVFRDVTTRRQTEQALRNAQLELERQAHTDSLTGLYNRRLFMQRLREEAERVNRHNGCLSILLFDLDHFKQVNDRFGHEAGDRVLQSVARAANEVKRVSDIIARIGGEEFALLLPETDREGAMNLAHRLRAAIESAKTLDPAGAPVSVTASIGVATVSAHSDGPASALKLADAALYRAKNAGRNQVRRAEPA
jgi:diguanylate cyclase (GGDEF)-like protein